MKNLWMAKDATSDRDDLISQSQNPDVVKAVLNEIEKNDDRHKQNYESLRKELHSLQSILEEKMSNIDPLVKDQVSKLIDSVTTRQNEIDKSIAEAQEETKSVITRIDELETAFRRPNGVMGDQSETDMEKAAMAFKIQCLSMTEEGAKWAIAKNMDPDVPAYEEYVKSFQSYLRMKGDERILGPETFKSLTVGADPEGGYTVTPAMGNRIIERVRETDPVRQLCSVESITTGAIEWLVDWGQAGYGWEGETETGDETGSPDFKKKRIPVHVCYAKPRATQTLLEDSGINIENWLSDHVASRFARAEGAAFVNGDGIGKPRGFLTYDNTASSGTPEWGKVEQVNMGNASALTADGFISIKYSLVEYYLNRGTWLMNRLTVAEALKLKDSDGQYLWRPGLEKDQPATILGLPVRMSTTMPSVAANALAVILADWAEFYMIVDRLGITVQRDPYTAKPFVEFYTRKRVGGDVINFDAARIGKIAA